MNPPMRSRQPHLRIAAAPGAKGEGARSRIRDRAEGERLLQHQGLKGLRAALAPPYGEDASTGWQHFWRGYILQFDDLAQARVEWLLAEARSSTKATSWGSSSPRAGSCRGTLLRQSVVRRFRRPVATRVAQLRPSDSYRRQRSGGFGWPRASC